MKRSGANFSERVRLSERGERKDESLRICINAPRQFGPTRQFANSVPEGNVVESNIDHTVGDRFRKTSRRDDVAGLLRDLLGDPPDRVFARQSDARRPERLSGGSGLQLNADSGDCGAAGCSLNQVGRRQ